MITALIIAGSITISLSYVIHKGNQANRVDWKHPVVNCIDGWARIYCRRFQRLEHDEMNIPQSGGVLVVCNHVSGLDPLVMVAACDRPLRFMIAIEEYNRPLLRPLFRRIGCIPVERQSKPEVAFRKAIQALEKGEAIALFPHGGIHTDDGGHRPIKRGVLKLAQLTNSTIIPTRVTGIRKSGNSFIPLFIRGRVKLQVFPHLPANFIDQENAKEDLGNLLLGKISCIEKQIKTSIS